MAIQLPEATECTVKMNIYAHVSLLHGHICSATFCFHLIYPYLLVAVLIAMLQDPEDLGYLYVIGIAPVTPIPSIS